jgi:hypothetical protein
MSSADNTVCVCGSCSTPGAVVYGSNTLSIDVRADGSVIELLRSGKTIGYTADAWAAQQCHRRSLQRAFDALPTREYKP